VIVDVALPSATIVVGFAVMVDRVGSGGPGVMLIGADSTATNPDAENSSVRFPTNPLIDKSVNVAVPFASVTAVDVPPSVPPPDAITASTLTPLCATGLPNPSTS
jgi:hypothetical protein